MKTSSFKVWQGVEINVKYLNFSAFFLFVRLVCHLATPLWSVSCPCSRLSCMRKKFLLPGCYPKRNLLTELIQEAILSEVLHASTNSIFSSSPINIQRINRSLTLIEILGKMLMLFNWDLKLRLES
jgi:hypothetical protein